MQTTTQYKTKQYLIFCLLAAAGIILAANVFGKETSTVVANLLYIPVTIALTVLSIIITKRFGTKGNHGKAWLMFVGFAISWLIAEHIWIIKELVYRTNPFPSLADFFYILGYPFLFLFSIYYLKPVKEAITKKIVLIACLASASLLVPSMYMTFTTNDGLDTFSFAIAVTYPILDSIVMVPAVISIMLFFRGEVNLLWALFSLAIMSTIGGDTGFLITQMNKSYYTGHPVEIMFYCAYILFAFGVYSYIKIFQKPNPKGRFEDSEQLR